MLGELILENDADGAQPESIAVARIISHPQYDDRAIENDIAVLELVREVEMRDGVRPACLPDPDGLAGQRLPEEKAVEVAGWGAVKFRGPTASHLQFGTIKTVSQTECQQKLSRFGNGESRSGPRIKTDYTFLVKINEKKLCARDVRPAGSHNIIDACQGLRDCCQ